MLRRKSAVFLSLLVVFALQTATASSGEEHGGELMDYLGKTVNFLLLFGGLAFVLARPVRNFLQELILSVEKTMTETEKARKEAERELEKIRKRLDGLAAEVQRIKEEGEAAGIKEKERILALARQEAERIKSYARLEIQGHAQAAQRRLREHAADLAISLAKSRIEKKMTDALHRRLIEKSIQGLGKLYEDTRPG